MVQQSSPSISLESDINVIFKWLGFVLSNLSCFMDVLLTNQFVDNQFADKTFSWQDDKITTGSTSALIWLVVSEISHQQSGLSAGLKTLRTQDTLDPRHFGTIRLVPKCPDSSAPVPKCLADTSTLVPNCLDLQQNPANIFAIISHTEERFNITGFYY